MNKTDLNKDKLLDLREESAEALKKIGFDGYAIGGLAIGEGQEKMFEVLDYAPSMLPDDKPRYPVNNITVEQNKAKTKYVVVIN